MKWGHVPHSLEVGSSVHIVWADQILYLSHVSLHSAPEFRRMLQVGGNACGSVYVRIEYQIDSALSEHPARRSGYCHQSQIISSLCGNEIGIQELTWMCDAQMQPANCEGADIVVVVKQEKRKFCGTESEKWSGRPTSAARPCLPPSICNSVCPNTAKLRRTTAIPFTTPTTHPTTTDRPTQWAIPPS